MKRIYPYLIGLIAGILVAIFFAVNSVFASPLATTGCFPDTNGHWAETFICWLADKGISSGYPDGEYKPSNNVTRAEMAVMMQKLAQIPPETGNIILGVGPEGWRPSGDITTHYIEYQPDHVELKAVSPNPQPDLPYTFQVGVDAPVILYGRYINLTGATLCYSLEANANITLVSLGAYGHNNGSGSAYREVVDNTPILGTDTTNDNNSTCKSYTISSPLNLIPKDHVSLYVEVEFLDTTAPVKIGSATFTFSPTGFASGVGPSPLRPLLP